MDFGRHTLLCGETAINLREKCWKLLEVLVVNNGELVSYIDILEALYPEDNYLKSASSTQDNYLKSASSTDDRIPDAVREIRKIFKRYQIATKLENVSKRGYRLTPPPVLLSEDEKCVKAIPSIHNFREKRFSESELRVHQITGGAPYYEEGSTLSVEFTGHEFYLRPPTDALENSDLKSWCIENGFVLKDIAFGVDLGEFIREIPIRDLAERIEKSRKKVFEDFRKAENGCYFNNKKYGIENINPFGRSRDEREVPKLDLEMYVTDYFTHRVMKDICKTLIAEGNGYLHQIDYTAIGANKIFFTSLGINLLILEDSGRDNYSTLITSRSTNAAETDQKHNFALSVIEGVSICDYDNFQRRIRLTLAVERGLREELGVEEHHLQRDTLKFYDLFVNRDNLEIGIFCTIELKKQYGIKEHIVDLRGKDDLLEISDKRTVPISELETFVRDNQDSIIPQAMYVLCSFLENQGIPMIERYRRDVIQKQSYICPKYGPNKPCGDEVVDSDHFIAIIDGEMPKGERLWGNLSGDVFVSKIIIEAIQKLHPKIDAWSAIEQINNAVKVQYEKNGIVFEDLAPEEQLQASVLIYSIERREVWSFGNCMLRINQKSYYNPQKGDVMLSDLRAFCMEVAALKKLDVSNDNDNDNDIDYGTKKIMPFLNELALFANSEHSFGYDVLNGGKILKERVKIYAVQPGDHIIMTSDGYPKIFNTLEETEEYLQAALREDPNCVGKLKGTRRLCKDAVSYDDRCFISFTVE